jgi:hypothetical protein
MGKCLEINQYRLAVASWKEEWRLSGKTAVKCKLAYDF